MFPIKFSTNTFIYYTLVLFSFLTSCGNDDETPLTLQSKTFEYQLHNGQAVPSAPYAGIHAGNLSASLLLEELENGNTNITVSIQNTMDGQIYHIHAHDAADPASTPNGTPYIEAPNTNIFAQMLNGNGATVSVSQEATQSFEALTATYEGFLVIHDPLQAINTQDISTYVVVGSFAREQAVVDYKSSTFQYAFNTGQLVADFAYTGTHNDNLSANIKVDELAENKSRVTVSIQNTMDGQTYHTHAHDMADPSTTPNGTPYIEAPNTDVFALPIEGNGATAAQAFISAKSHDDITSTYDGFFVVHDPLQAVSTVDPTTYVLLGIFAR